MVLTGPQFENWLRHQFYLEKKTFTPATALRNCLSTLEADAHFRSSARREVYLRVAKLGDSVFLDLADPESRIIEVTASGWRIARDAPVRFRRSPHMAALPLPLPGGSIDQLRRFVNASDGGFTLFVCALVDALIEGHPHPVIFLAGEEGTTKTTLAKVARALTDPNSGPAKSLPGTRRDLFVDVQNSYAVCYDNLSALSRSLSDAICMVSTGSAYSTRKNYTDSDLVVLGGQARPVMLTGLRNVISRPDLADRTIILPLDYVDPRRRMTEAEFEEQFALERPLIIGALLDLVAHALKNMPDVRPALLPRMADFARIATACESGFTETGSFAKAYAASTAEATLTVAAEQPSGVVFAVLSFMETRSSWEGTATQLLDLLTTNDRTEERVAKAKTWPKDYRTFGVALAESASTLRRMGVVVKKVAKRPF
jgi:hypothetical protein